MMNSQMKMNLVILLDIFGLKFYSFFLLSDL